MTPVVAINRAVKRLRKAEELLTRQHELNAGSLTASELEYVHAIPSMIAFLECASNAHWHRTTNVPDWHGQSRWQDIALNLARTVLKGES